jgi:hypothetical protein
MGLLVCYDEMLVDASFDAARARLADLARGGMLLDASQYAYGEGIAGVARIGPPASVRGMSRLAEAHFRGPVIREDTAVLTLRWEAIGPGGGLFPALDADITLSPAGDRGTLLSLAGAYRPAPGALDTRPGQVTLQRVAAATIRPRPRRGCHRRSRGAGRPSWGDRIGHTPPDPGRRGQPPGRAS